MSDDLDTMQGAPAPRVLDDAAPSATAGDAPVLAAPVLAAPDLAPRRAPRPVSAPSHRAAVPVEVVRNHADEPRPVSVARHSADTSSIPLPVLPVAVDPSLPQPPERLTLDDGDLVRLVGDRFADTATIDLVAVVQAQMAARRVEAERFASWESEMRRHGGSAAEEALERTRLRFTGVIPVQRPVEVEPALLALATQGPEARVAPAAPVPSAHPAASGPVRTTGPVLLGTAPTDLPAGVPADVVSADTAPVRVQHQTGEIAPALDGPASSSGTSASSEPSRRTRRDVGASAPSSVTPSPAAGAPRTVLAPRTLLSAAVVAAALGVVAALVLAVAVPGSLVAALVATLALPAVAGLAAFGGLALVQAGPADADRVRARGPLALVLGVALGTVLALGVLTTTVAALSWQGWALRLVGVELSVTVSVVAALLVAAAASFVATVLVVGFRGAARR